ncbi:MAG TPA: ABC transporter permease [Candidatus Limnocylindrales bacterium]|nr:ABC transporter permease [Candidatus Limnocylindrales bacterium]
MDITQEAPAAFRTSATRPGPLGMLAEAVGDLRSRWRLVRYLAQADLKRKGTNTFFGNVWWILDPLLQMAVYVILVTVIFQRDTPAYPLFIFAAILPWKWFSTVISDAITSVSGQERLIKQIQFPKIVLPAAAMIAGIAQFLFGLIPLFAMLILFYADRISPALVFIPVVAVVQFTFTMALGLILASLNVFFRDVGNLARHVLRLWFYLSPALYGAETIATLDATQPAAATAMRLNPFFTILESYRDAIYYERAPDFVLLGLVFAFSLALLIVGTIFFKRLEPSFAKVL